MGIRTITIQTAIGSSKMKDFKKWQRWFSKCDVMDLLRDRIDSLRWQLPKVAPERIPHGIIDAVLHRAGSKQKRLFIDLSIHLEACRTQSRSDRVFSCNNHHIIELTEKLDRIIEPALAIKCPIIEDWSCHSVQFAIDIPTKNARQYVMLAERSLIPIHAGCVEPCEAGFRITQPSGQVQFEYYYDMVDNAETIELARKYEPYFQPMGVVHMNVLCQAERLDKLRQEAKNQGYADYGRKLKTFLHAGFSNWVIQDYYKKTTGYGDYYSFAEALKILQSRRYNRQKQQSIETLLRNIASYSWEMVHQQIYSPNTNQLGIQGLPKFRTYMQYLAEFFTEMKLNPVTLPGSRYLENPMPQELRLLNDQ